MNRTPVESSNIKSVGFDPETNRLSVEFRNDRVYEYVDVPQTVYNSFMASSSKGQYLAAVIKPTYRCERVG